LPGGPLSTHDAEDRVTHSIARNAQRQPGRIGVSAVMLGASLLAIGCGGADLVASSSGEGGADAAPPRDAVSSVEDSAGGHDSPAVLDSASRKDSAGGQDASQDVSQDVESDVLLGPTKIVFVSSQTYTGNLGGLSGADANCQTLAAAAGLSGTFKAWLSDGSVNAATRLAHSTVPYTLPDGTLVAKDWSQLTSGALVSYIEETETGGLPPPSNTFCGCEGPDAGPSSAAAWTDTDAMGALVDPAFDCSNWTSAVSPNSDWGAVYPPSAADWASSCSGAPGCGAFASLYCLEQ
jgi:hypothetical protein